MSGCEKASIVVIFFLANHNGCAEQTLCLSPAVEWSFKWLAPCFERNARCQQNKSPSLLKTTHYQNRRNVLTIQITTVATRQILLFYDCYTQGKNRSMQQSVSTDLCHVGLKLSYALQAESCSLGSTQHLKKQWTKTLNEHRQVISQQHTITTSV